MDGNTWLVITQHLILIQEGGKNETYMLSHTVFSGNSLQGHPPNKVKHLSLGTLFN